MLTSAQLLKQLALSVDHVAEAEYARLIDLVRSYFRDTERACFFDVVIDGFRIERGNQLVPALDTAIPERDSAVASIFNEDGTYRGQRAFCYDKGLPLWITADNSAPLRETSETGGTFIDSWSTARSGRIPAYQFPRQGDPRTSVLYPLRYGPRVFGVMVVEFEDELRFTARAKLLVSQIGDAVSRIIWLRETTKNQLQDTQRAVAEVSREIRFDRGGIRPPTLFLAYSSRADNEVVGELIGVLDGYCDEIEVVDWSGMGAPGSVTSQIREAISQASFGICYFSESDGDNAFTDNPNVLFEAGMLHATKHDTDEQPNGWIPIREDKALAGDPPFDFAERRFVIVPRLNDGRLNAPAFRERLNNVISAMVKVDP